MELDNMCSLVSGFFLRFNHVVAHISASFIFVASSTPLYGDTAFVYPFAY